MSSQRQGRWPWIVSALVVASMMCGCPGKQPTEPEPPEPTSADEAPEDERIRPQPIRTPLACVKDGQVWLMDGGGDERRLVSAPGRAIPDSLQWSADSARLAFWTIEGEAATHAGPFRLCVLAASKAGAAEVVHTTEPGLGGDRPFFSSHGAVVCAAIYGGEDERGSAAGGLFAHRFTRNKGLLRFRLAGGAPEPLLPDRELARGPLRWPELAPDGKTLVGVGGRDLPGGYLAIVDFASLKVTEERSRDALRASWSPRKRRLAYLRYGERGTLELRVWGLEDKDSVQVVAGLSPDATFAWGPDGKAIAYTNVDEFVVVAEDPTGEWVATRTQTQEGSVHRWPTWAPEGQAIVLELHPSGERERILMRDPFGPTVSPKKFFPGGTRPLFAPG